MFKVKEVDSKITPAKKNITISGVKIDGSTLVDEDGSIVDKLADEIGNDEFTIKISIELPDEDAE